MLAEHPGDRRQGEHEVRQPGCSTPVAAPHTQIPPGEERSSGNQSGQNGNEKDICRLLPGE